MPISTTFLTGTVFLAFYTSVASPAAVSPNHAGLLRREVPRDSLCGNMEWMYRDCLPNVSPLAYKDTCLSHAYNTYLPVRGYCPVGTKCVDGYDLHTDKIISCVPTTKAGDPDTITTSGAQAGSSGTKEGFITPKMSMSHETQVKEDIHGSLEAVLVSENDDFILTPAGPIVGKIHGKDYTVCAGVASDAIKSMECFPTGLFDFDEGDQIDFTWEMKNGQKGSLKYALTPAR